MEKTQVATGITSFLVSQSSVVLVPNDTIEGSPLVTPLRNADGTPKTDNLGNAIGSIRVEQHSRNLNGSYLNSRRRVAFIGGSLNDLMSIVSQNKLKAGSELPGKIQIQESLEPMWKGQSSKVNPETGEEIGVRVGDTFYPVYAKSTYTEDMNANDFLIRNSEDVSNWFAARKVLSEMTSTAVDNPVVPA